MVTIMDERLQGRNFERVLGNKYGRLEVIDDLVYWEPGKRRFVRVKCSCPDKTIKLVGLPQLKNGNSKSCGCLQREITIERSYKHGYNKRGERNPLYDLFHNMKNRSYNKKNKSYKNYGGRGVIICKEWLEDNSLFFNWCLSNGWKEGLEIDRENNDGNYDPVNCRFVTSQENNENRRLLQTRNKSGYRGVYKRKYSFAIHVTRKGKTLFDKSGFQTAKDAAIARDIFCIKNNIPYALNFPELAINGPL